MKQLRRPNVKKGSLVPLGNDFLLAVGTHPNKVDDIDIGPNNKNGLSVNHGEILQVTKDNNYANGGSAETIRVFSAEPMLEGISPAQLLYRGMPADKVFAMQEQYKRIHRLNSDGTHYYEGGENDNNKSNSIIKKIIDKITSSLKKSNNTSINWSGIKTTNNRTYNPEYIDYINKGLVAKGVGKNQRAAILANIIEESGGDPFAVDSTKQFKGLLQWEQSRYWPGKETDAYKELNNQINYIYDTLGNTTDKKSWTHGGKSSGYNSLTDAIAAFNSEDDLDAAMKGYTLGYVRPTGKLDSYNNRLKVAKQIIEKEGFKNGGIHIAPSKRGTFTAAAKKYRMSVQGFASKVLANKDDYSPAMVKKANFARNASKWKHLYGGEDTLINPLGERPNVNSNENMKNKRTKNDYGGNNNTPYTLVTTSTGYKRNPILIKIPIDFREAMHKANLNIIRARMQKEGIDSYMNNQLSQLNNININKSFVSDIYPDTNERIKNNLGNELYFDPYKEFSFGETTAFNPITKKLEFGYKPFIPNLESKKFNRQTNDTIYGELNKVLTSKGLKPVTLPNSNISNISTNTKLLNDSEISNGFPAWIGDAIGTGINIAGSAITHTMNRNYIDKLKFTPRKYGLVIPAKLKTKINIYSQLAKIREEVAKYTGDIKRNTASSRTALNRIGNIRNRGLLSSMGLYGEQENKETELINKDRLNQQEVNKYNLKNVMDTINYNIAGKDNLENMKAQLKAQNDITLTNNIANAIIGERGFLARAEDRASKAANLAAIIMSNPDSEKLLTGDIYKKAYKDSYGMYNRLW